MIILYYVQSFDLSFCTMLICNIFRALIYYKTKCWRKVERMVEIRTDRIQNSATRMSSNPFLGKQGTVLRVGKIKQYSNVLDELLSKGKQEVGPPFSSQIHSLHFFLGVFCQFKICFTLVDDFSSVPFGFCNLG